MILRYEQLTDEQKKVVDKVYKEKAPGQVVKVFSDGKHAQNYARKLAEQYGAGFASSTQCIGPTHGRPSWEWGACILTYAAH